MGIGIANSGTNNINIFLEYGNVGILLGYGNGIFADMQLFPTGYRSRPFAVIVSDFNNDRKLYFAVANSDTNNLRIFLETCN
jgi:hypothetical protein